MYKFAIAVLLLALTGGAAAATATAPKTAKPVRAPLLEKLSCSTGPNDEQARLIVMAVKGRVMEFAFYSRLGTRVCSIHAQRGDSFSKWEDANPNGGSAAIQLLTGSAQIEYTPGHVLLKFTDVERLKYCGMYGELNATIEVFNKKPACGIIGVFDGVDEKDVPEPARKGPPTAAK